MTAEAPRVATYRGYYRSGSGGVIEALAADGTTIGIVAHLPKHSPTGMSWGYLGSGPSDAARSLLIAVIGDAARCSWCSGDGRPGCLCDGGFRFLPYHAFKEQVIARLPDDWTLPRQAVVAWLLEHVPEAPELLLPPPPGAPAPRRPADDEGAT